MVAVECRPRVRGRHRGRHSATLRVRALAEDRAHSVVEDPRPGARHGVDARFAQRGQISARGCARCSARVEDLASAGTRAGAARGAVRAGRARSSVLARQSRGGPWRHSSVAPSARPRRRARRSRGSGRRRSTPERGVDVAVDHEGDGVADGGAADVVGEGGERVEVLAVGGEQARVVGVVETGRVVEARRGRRRGSAARERVARQLAPRTRGRRRARPPRRARLGGGEREDIRADPRVDPLSRRRPGTADAR